MSTYTLQTAKRKTSFNTLDFRTKMYVMVTLSAVAFMWESLIMEILLFLLVVAFCLWVGVKLSYLQNLLILMIPFCILLVITQGFFADDMIYAKTGQTELTPVFVLPEKWWLVGSAVMSWEGIEYALSTVVKTFTLTLIIPLVVFTTDINDMIVGMVKVHIPYKVAFIFSSTLRFFPLLFDEIQTIIESQQLRGLDINKMGPIKRIRVYSKIAVPLILGALVKTQQLEVVLQSKAFSGSPDRTYFHDSKLQTSDYCYILVSSICVVVSIFSYILWDVGRFKGPI
jgi:energy-coupling factor transport system permease protein